MNKPRSVIVVLIACLGLAGCSDASEAVADADTRLSADISDVAPQPDGQLPGGGPDAVAPEGDVTADGPSWKTLPPVAGGAVQESGVCVLQGQVYVVGGLQNLFQIAAGVHRYDVASASWESVASLPEPVHHPNVASAAGRVYVLGALSGLGFTAVDVAWAYDPADDRWDEVRPMPESRRRGAAAVTTIGDDVYVVGGYRGAATAEVSVYRAAEDTWQALAPLPIVADHVVAEAVGGVIYVIGGRDTATGIADVVDDVWAYEPDSDTWSARAAMPTARAGSMAGVIDGRIVVVGGEGNPQHPRGVFAEVEVYDPAADSWSVLGPMPTPRHGTGAAALGDTLYVPAGADKELFGAVDVFEALTLPGASGAASPQ